MTPIEATKLMGRSREAQRKVGCSFSLPGWACASGFGGNNSISCHIDRRRFSAYTHRLTNRGRFWIHRGVVEDIYDYTVVSDGTS